MATDVSMDCGHGRVEVRKCCVVNDLEFLDDAYEWKDLQSKYLTQRKPIRNQKIENNRKRLLVMLTEN